MRKEMYHSVFWDNAIQLDILGTAFYKQDRDVLARQYFEDAFEQYNLAYETEPSDQLLFEFASFCWCLTLPGTTTPITENGFMDQCCDKRIELMATGLTKYKENGRILFLHMYINHRYGEDITIDDVLETVDPNNPADIPYFLLYLLSNKEKYYENAKLLWVECTKRKTQFNQYIIELLEYDCDPKLIRT
jgi:hypothetical protein